MLVCFDVRRSTNERRSVEQSSSMTASYPYVICVISRGRNTTMIETEAQNLSFCRHAGKMICKPATVLDKGRSNARKDVLSISPGYFSSHATLIHFTIMESRHTPCSIPFLSRDKLYETEKPYGLDFAVDHIEGARMTNHIFDIEQVLVEDVRFLLQPLTMEANGACFIRAKTSLRAGEEAMTQTPAMRQYINEILHILRDSFPEYREIRLMDFQVRQAILLYTHELVLSLKDSQEIPRISLRVWSGCSTCPACLDATYRLFC